MADARRAAGRAPGYFAPGLAALRFDLDALDDEFLAVAPDAHAALEKTGCHLRCFTPRWLLCVMVGTAPAAAALRVWDTLLLDAPGAFDSNSETSGRCARERHALAAVQAQGRAAAVRAGDADRAGRARAIAAAPGAAEAVESIRAAGRGVTDLQARLLRRVRDLSPGARPAGLRAALGSTAAALAAAAAAASRGPARRNAAAATAAAATTPRAGRGGSRRAAGAHAFAPCSRRCAARPLGSPRSARVALGPRASRRRRRRRRAREGWRRVAGRGAATERRREKDFWKRKTASEMDGGCGATPSRRRAAGVDAMASWASPPSLRSPTRAAAGYGPESPLATRSPLARMR